MGDGGDTQQHEFDDVAAWTAAVLADEDDATVRAATCRGSGSPSALAWLAESLELTATTRLLDVGSGLGGPSAWAAGRYGVDTFGAEPMEGAVRGAVALFGRPDVVALADSLPFASASFDVAWTLGVLDTVDRPDHLLAEVHRCLRPGGRFAVLAYVAEARLAESDIPEGNTFPTTEGLVADLADAGLVVVDRVGPAGLPAVPAGWSQRQDAVEEELARRHGDDDGWREAKANEDAFAALLDDGRVEAVLLLAERR